MYTRPRHRRSGRMIKPRRSPRLAVDGGDDGESPAYDKDDADESTGVLVIFLFLVRTLATPSPIVISRCEACHD